MIFLLPPSETKTAGGSGVSISQLALTFGALNSARDQVLAAASATHLAIEPTMPAVDRYSGTLYAAIHGRGLKGSPTANNLLSSDERARAKEMVLIQSAMFGLISSLDQIPNYKLSPSKKVGELNLKLLWTNAQLAIWPRLSNGPIIDLRSKAYADLAPVPQELKAYSVIVYVERPDGSLDQLNHFNKKAKGQLVRAALTASRAPQSITELKACAKKSGLKIEVSGQELKLITSVAT